MLLFEWRFYFTTHIQCWNLDILFSSYGMCSPTSPTSLPCEDFLPKPDACSHLSLPTAHNPEQVLLWAQLGLEDTDIKIYFVLLFKACMYLAIKANIGSCDESCGIIAITAGCPCWKGFLQLYVVLYGSGMVQGFFSPRVLILQFVLLLKDNNCWVDLFTKPDLQVYVNHCTMNRKEKKKNLDQDQVQMLTTIII